MGRPPRDLTGQTFGRLTAVRSVGRRGQHLAWLCRCQCGAESIVQARTLTAGHSRSCGCLRRELTGNRFRGKTKPTEGYRDLRDEGWSYRRIAAHFGVSHESVRQRLLREND